LEGVLFIRLMEYYPHTAIRHFSFVFHIPWCGVVFPVSLLESKYELCDSEHNLMSYEGT
jgi:hypothetical protein